MLQGVGKAKAMPLIIPPALDLLIPVSTVVTAVSLALAP